MRAALLLTLLLVLPAARAELFATPRRAAEIEALVSAETRASAHGAALTGSFVQKKFLAELPQPLRSSGDFVYARGRGVIWRVRQPLSAEYVLAGNTLIAREGGSEQRLGAEAQPGLAAVSRLFAALFALDLESLERDFLLYGERSGSRWSIGLKPRHAALTGALTVARLDGSRQLERVVITDGRGDRTEIELEQLQALDALPAEALARFP